MATNAVNPLLATNKATDVQVALHPLVLLGISDYVTRHTLRKQPGPVIGGLLGRQSGDQITFEQAFDAHTKPDPGVPGYYALDHAKFGQRLEQMRMVHQDPQLDLVGWYTLTPPTGPTETILPIHFSMIENYGESTVLVAFHPAQLLEQAGTGKLPISVYESLYELDETQRHAATEDDGDSRMDEGEQRLKLKFREVPYRIDTGDAEMICIDYIAAGGANAAVPVSERSTPVAVEAKDRGKRRAVAKENDDAPDSGSQAEADENQILSTEEQEMIAALTRRANAITMLRSRIQLVVSYLESLPENPTHTNSTGPDEVAMADADAPGRPAATPTPHSGMPSAVLLRQIKALVDCLNLVVPSDTDLFDREMLRDQNDVQLLSLVEDTISAMQVAVEAGQRFSLIDGVKKVKEHKASLLLAAAPEQPSSTLMGRTGTATTAAGDLLI